MTHDKTWKIGEAKQNNDNFLYIVVGSESKLGRRLVCTCIEGDIFYLLRRTILASALNTTKISKINGLSLITALRLFSPLSIACECRWQRWKWIETANFEIMNCAAILWFWANQRRRNHNLNEGPLVSQ